MAETDPTTELLEGEQGGASADADKPSVDHAAEAEKWKAMARKHEARAKENADAAKRLSEIEESNKTDLEKAQAASAMAEKRATEAEAKATRFEVAAEKGVPQKLLKFLGGNTREEIEAAADELLEATQPDKGSTGGKPKEALRGGASDGDASSEKSVAEILKATPRAT